MPTNTHQIAPRQHGFSLLEVGIVLVIAAFVAFNIYTRFIAVDDRNNARTTSDLVRDVAVACREVRSGNSYNGVNNTVLSNAGLVPEGLSVSGSTFSHPLNGTVTLAAANHAGGTDNVCQQTWTNLDSASCSRIIGSVESQMEYIAKGTTVVKSDTVTPTSALVATACSGATNTVVFRSR